MNKWNGIYRITIYTSLYVYFAIWTRKLGYEWFDLLTVKTERIIAKAAAKEATTPSNVTWRPIADVDNNFHNLFTLNSSIIFTFTPNVPLCLNSWFSICISSLSGFGTLCEKMRCFLLSFIFNEWMIKYKYVEKICSDGNANRICAICIHYLYFLFWI